MPCVSKPICTHGIIISLWLICYIQCRFSISYLSILVLAGHDRCRISHIFLFSFRFRCPMSCCPFVFQDDSNRGSEVVFNFSQCLLTSFLHVHNGIYYNYY